MSPGQGNRIKTCLGIVLNISRIFVAKQAMCALGYFITACHSRGFYRESIVQMDPR